jgi:hypothetical protein
MIINPYVFNPPLLLDTYPSAAGAYSIRKLRTAYTGSCLRVRRSSDNAETDIGFVLNYIDTAAISSFIGANDGFVVKFYDQSGNANDLTQSTAARQPQIVSAGSILTLNSKVSLRCQTVLQGFSSALNFTFSQCYIATVFNRTGRINTTDNLWAFNGAPYNQLYSSSTNWSLFYGSVLNTTIPLSTAQKLITQNYDNVTTYIYDNSTLNSQANTSFTISNLALNVFGFFAFNYGSQGNLQEFIIYTTNKTSVRAAIETEIKNFYGI